jgi:hypothetical protein
LGTSEFERDGVHPFGGFGVARAWEKVRYIVRTGLNPEPPDAANLDASADDWGTGGLRDPNDQIL